MRIALIGNQNSGKTTLFNLLTGSNQKVGNWPGVTIERKVGYIKNTDYELIDLPGVYSLSPYSNEEKISRTQILTNDLDCLINIVDATSLERSLYLTTQLLELDVNVIVVLNMADMLEKKKLRIDEKKLSLKLGCPVIKISALKKIGIDKLIKEIENNKPRKELKIFTPLVEEKIKLIEKNIIDKHKRFISVKILENDYVSPKYSNIDVSDYVSEIEKEYAMEIMEVIASQRYDFIEEVKKECLRREELSETITDKLDKILLNKYSAIPIFIVLMFLVYFFSVGVVGSFTVDLMEKFIETLSESATSWLEGLNASPWAVSIIVDGIIAGVGAVINFIPQLIILFLLISMLESSGYMARISFILDRFFKRIGLSGKSLIPFILGTGCSVPGVMASRTVENEDERKMTILLTPFVPCSAKLPIIALFSTFFFPNYSGLISASLYFFSIIVIIISAIILKRFVFKGKRSTYILELPEYRLPSLSYTFKDVRDRTFSFIKKAGSIILLSSIVIWFLSSFSLTFKYGVDVNESILSYIGRAISWVFYPMLGELSWGASVSAIQGIIAKEQVVSSMSIIAGLSGDANNMLFEPNSIFGFFTPASAYAFMVFNLFSAPCLGTIGAMKKEYNSGKLAFKAILFQTSIAWVLGVLVYLVGSIL